MNQAIWKIVPSRERSHIPPKGKLGKSSTQNAIFGGIMLVPWRVVKMGIFPKDRGENNTYIWNQHLEKTHRTWKWWFVWKMISLFKRDVFSGEPAVHLPGCNWRGVGTCWIYQRCFTPLGNINGFWSQKHCYTQGQEVYPRPTGRPPAPFYKYPHIYLPTIQICTTFWPQTSIPLKDSWPPDAIGAAWTSAILDVSGISWMYPGSPTWA